jgi:hypothetical protein
MSVLDKENMDAFAQALNDTGDSVGVIPEEPVVEQPAPEVEQDVQTEEVLDANVETVSSTEPEEEGHSVPYGRFKSVNDQRRQLQQEVESYRNRFAEVEQQLAQLRDTQTAPPPQRYEVPQEANEDDTAWLDSLLDETPTEEAPNPQWTELSQRLEAFEVRQAEADLQSEIQQAQGQYPSVPDEVLLNAVIADPEVNVMDIAAQYSTFIASIEEDAIAKYVERTGNRRAVAPRPKTTSGGSTARSHARGADEKITLSNARDKLADAIKTGKIQF